MTFHSLYGPYKNLDDACSLIPLEYRLGTTFGILTGSTIFEYWWSNPNNITNTGYIIKTIGSELSTLSTPSVSHSSITSTGATITFSSVNPPVDIKYYLTLDAVLVGQVTSPYIINDRSHGVNVSISIVAKANGYIDSSAGTDSFTTNAIVPSLAATTVVSAITDTTATSGGNVTSDGGSTITSRGVCWDTSTNPTIVLSTKTVDAGTTGVFTSSLTSLTTETLYYVRSYATNSIGTTYGTQVTFTTL